MKINFTAELKTLGGEPLQPPTTLKEVAVNILLTLLDDERNLPGEEKAKRSLLATRIYANPENIDLTVEELALIKKLIGKAYTPLIVGQAWQMLEGA
jgi:hypothetical protein